MKLKVLANYRNDVHGLSYLEGEVLDVRDETGRWLLADAPGCFEVMTDAVERDERNAKGPRRAVPRRHK